MPERNNYSRHFAKEAQARRVRFSAMAQGIRVLQESALRGEITPEQADRVSKLIIGGWAVGQIREMAYRQLDPEKLQVLFDSKDNQDANP